MPPEPVNVPLKTETEPPPPPRSAPPHTKTRDCPKYPVNDRLPPRKHPPTSNSPQTPSNLICLTIFVILRPLTQFSPKISATNLQKSAKFFLP